MQPMWQPARHTPKDRLSLALEIAKAVGLLAAGVWTIFIYVTLQRNFSDPTLPNLASTATLEPRAHAAGAAQAMILRVRHQNLGKVDVRITHAVIRLFYGKLTRDGSDPVLRLNMPPAIGTESLGSPGAIAWRGISYDGCVTPAMAASEDMLVPSDMSAYSFNSGGSCGTGVVRAAGTLEQVFDVVYTEDPDAYVGAAAAFAFDDGSPGKSPRMNNVTALVQAIPAAAAPER